MSLEKYKNDKKMDFFYHKKIARINKMIDDSVNLKNRLVEVNHQVGLVLKDNPNGPFERAVRRNDKHIARLNSWIDRLTSVAKIVYHKNFASQDNFDEQVKMMLKFGLLNGKI